MASVTVRAEAAVLGLDHGQTVTVERTEFLDTIIEAGKLTVVDDQADSKPDQAPENEPAAEQPAGADAAPAPADPVHSDGASTEASAGS